jgi:hypothetical protein
MAFVIESSPLEGAAEEAVGRNTPYRCGVADFGVELAPNFVEAQKKKVRIMNIGVGGRVW